MKIAILDDWQRIARSTADWSPLEARAEVVFFEAPFVDADDAAGQLADFDIIFALRERTPFPVSLIERLPKLKMFALAGFRAAMIDIAALIDRGVVVCGTDGGPSVESTAELALALMLAAARKIPAGDTAVRNGRFQVGTEAGFQLAGKTIGLIGLGRIGALMARYCTALDMEVLAWSPNLTDERAAAAGAIYAPLDSLLDRSDAVSMHLVLSERTRGVLGAPELARVKPGTIVINTSRAALIEQQALLDAVAEGRIVAALDVHYVEPMPPGHPFHAAHNTVLTPHLGYSVLDVYAVYLQQSVENILAYLDGTPTRVLGRP